MLALNFVYVVGDSRAVKLGKSTTPEARIASLNPASSAPLVTYYGGATNGNGGAQSSVGLIPCCRAFLAVALFASAANGSLPRQKRQSRP